MPMGIPDAAAIRNFIDRSAYRGRTHVYMPIRPDPLLRYTSIHASHAQALRSRHTSTYLPGGVAGAGLDYHTLDDWMRIKETLNSLGV